MPSDYISAYAAPINLSRPNPKELAQTPRASSSPCALSPTFEWTPLAYQPTHTPLNHYTHFVCFTLLHKLQHPIDL